MLSLVSVFNDDAKVQARLVAGLKRQDTPHQLVLVDNRDGRFRSAAAALNWGARQAVGDWVVFLHQDVELLAEDWLRRTELWLRPGSGPQPVWHGVVGRNARGRWRGLASRENRAMVFRLTRSAAPSKCKRSTKSNSFTKITDLDSH